MTSKFVEGIFSEKFLGNHSYQSPEMQIGLFTRLFPSISFYSRLLVGPFRWLCRRAANGLCDDYAWVYGSIRVAELLEETGCRIFVEGMEHFENLDGPCVFVANHMSTLETFMLPGIIRPRRQVTYVLKESLVNLPLFGAVIRSRNPITVGRKNPRHDLAAILEGGMERLAQGISLIVFPQSTRSKTFNADHFNSIGIKLAKRAKVPLIPIALKTDAWGQGLMVKDIGAISPVLPVRYSFGPALYIEGPGKIEQNAVTEYIATHLNKWNQTDNILGMKKGLPDGKP